MSDLDATQVGPTTTTVADAVENTATQPLRNDLTSLLNPMNMGVKQDILGFLAKPTILQSGTFAHSDTATTFGTMNLPTAVLTPAIIGDKLKGFYGIRHTSVFTLQVNANPFQQGRYILYFCPTAGANIAGTYATNWHKQHAYTLTEITQLPHVEIDLACDTQATLVVPFRSVEYNFSIASLASADAYGGLGYLRIVPYSSLDYGTGSATCGYTLWHHFEQVELSAPTVPQSSKWKSKKMSIVSAETQKETKGPVSSAFSHASLAASALTMVPLISPFAATAAWALDCASGVASVFGWSKPPGVPKTERMINSYAVGMNNVDGVDQVYSMGTISNNEIAPLNGVFGTDIDEMSFDYIKAIPAYFTNFAIQVGTGYAAGDLIKVINVGLDDLRVITTDAGIINVVSQVPARYIAKFFDFWRGSITYKFKFIKTDFHTARIAISYVPFDARYPTPTMSLANTNYVHRIILDIREGNEATITVPFVAPGSWLGQSDATGRLYVHIVDPLTFPDTVASQVVVLVEACGGPDLEYASPRKNLHFPYIPTAPQSGNWKSDPCDMITDVIGGSKILTTTLHSEACIGESVKSFRALGKIYNQIARIVFVANVVQEISPYLYTIAYNNAGTPAGILEKIDIYTHLCNMYALSRGGVRIKIANISPGAAALYISPHTPVNSTTNASIVSATTGTNSYSCRPQLQTSDIITGDLDIQLPQFMQYHSRNNIELQIGASPGTIAQTHGPVKRWAISCELANTRVFYRALADDSSFGIFCTVPPVLLAPDA